MLETEAKDTEIVLGTGKLLAIFFGLAAICGTFFGLGYSLGRSSGPMSLQSGPSTLVSGPGAKTGAGVTLTTPAVMADATPPADAGAAPDSQKSQDASASGAASSGQSAPGDAAPTPTVKPAGTQTAPTENVAAKTATPELEGASITVQVAAVTKQEDAEALVSALRKKNYPVFVSPNASTDNLYHVQVGPFAELKDAEAMKSKLAGDGYNAIVKK